MIKNIKIFFYGILLFGYLFIECPQKRVFFVEKNKFIAKLKLLYRRKS